MKRLKRIAAVLVLLVFVLAAGYLLYTCRQPAVPGDRDPVTVPYSL